MTDRAPPADGPLLPRVTTLHTASGRRKPTADEYVAALCRGALLGAFAIVLGWVATEQSGAARSTTLFGIAVYVGMLGAIYGLITTAWGDFVDRLWSRAFERAAIGAWVGLAGGMISGAIAFELYSNLQHTTADPSGTRFYVLRALAWAIFGAGIGVAPGLAERASRKVTNGIIGGAIGGALGGAVQHWSSFEVAAASEARLLGLVAIGVCIGAATAVVELVRRKVWLHVVGGGMTGKQFILYHRESDIGSSAKAQITLVKDPLIAPRHARITDSDRMRTINALDGVIAVNGRTVRERSLRDGDLIQVGSTTLRYAEDEPDSS